MLCGPRWEAGVEVEGEGTASGDDGRTFPNATSTATCRPEQLREPRAGGTASWRAGAGEGRGAGEVGPAQRPPPRPPPPGDGTRPGRRGGSLRGPKEPLRLSCSQQNASHTQTKAFPGKRRLRERTEGLAPKGPGRRAAGTADAGGGGCPRRAVFSHSSGPFQKITAQQNTAEARPARRRRGLAAAGLRAATRPAGSACGGPSPAGLVFTSLLATLDKQSEHGQTHRSPLAGHAFRGLALSEATMPPAPWRFGQDGGGARHVSASGWGVGATPRCPRQPGPVSD